jgi:uncharacterized membrane protein
MKQTLFSIVLFFSYQICAQTPGNALSFDGTDDMVVINSVPALFSNLGTNDFTFEAWMNPNASAFQRIIFAQPNANNFATMGTGNGNVIYFYVVVNGITYSQATSASIPQNQWSHVACRWISSTQTPQILFNGVVQPSLAGGSSSSGTNGLLTIGTRPGGAQFFNGTLDEVRIWSEARTDCEISANYNSEFTSVQPNLIAYYNFNQGIPSGTNTSFTSLPDINTTFMGTLTNFTLTGLTSNWVSSGAVINTTGTNSATPAAPTGSAVQSFCDSATINDLVVSGSSILWYDNVIGGSPILGTTALVNGTTYYASQSINGCESTSRLSVDVTINAPLAPTASQSQSFCNSATIDDLVASGSSILWYDNAIGGTPMLGSTALVNGTTYYASQSINGCESNSLLAVTATIIETAPPTGSSSQTYCIGATIDDLIASGTSILWYDNTIGGTPMLGSTALVNGTTYYASQSINGCVSNSLLAVTVTINETAPPTGSSSQTYCIGVTIDDLIASGTSILWYDNAIGGTSMLGSTALVNGTTYYASQSINGCESNSLFAVNITINTVGDITTNLTGITLSANNTTANYQWLDCNTNFSPLQGENSQSFTATVNGYYAVLLTQNGCADTSECISITGVGLSENTLINSLNIYPNPVSTHVTLTIEEQIEHIRIYDLMGKEWMSSTPQSSQAALDVSTLPSGIYMVNVTSESGTFTERLIKN